jgi:hypothetical protein
MEKSGKKTVDKAETNSVPQNEKELWRIWVDFTANLFLGTLWRFIVFGGVGLIFCIITAMTFFFFVMPDFEWSVWLKIPVGLLALIIFIVLGLAAGLGLAICRTMLENISNVEHGVHILSEPILEGIANRLPKGESKMKLSEFKVLVNEQMEKHGRYKPPGILILSPFSAISFVVRRVLLLALKFVLINDFIEVHEKRNKRWVSTSSVLTYSREKIVQRVADVYRFYVLLVQIVCWVVFGLIALLSIILELIY